MFSGIGGRKNFAFFFCNRRFSRLTLFYSSIVNNPSLVFVTEIIAGRVGHTEWSALLRYAGIEQFRSHSFPRKTDDRKNFSRYFVCTYKTTNEALELVKHVISERGQAYRRLTRMSCRQTFLDWCRGGHQRNHPKLTVDIFRSGERRRVLRSTNCMDN